MRKAPALRAAPSEKVVRQAWVEFTETAQNPEVSGEVLSLAVARFLDLFGVEGLEDPRAAARITPIAGKHLLAAFDGSQVELSSRVKAVLALEVVQRLSAVDLRDARWLRDMPTVTWLQVLLRRAVERLPSAGVSDVLANIVDMSLVTRPGDDLFAEGVAGGAADVWLCVVMHPDCPVSVLRDACLNQSTQVALLATAHPACPEDAQIAVSLRV